MKKLDSHFLPKLLALTIAGFVIFDFAVIRELFGKIVDVFQPIFIGIVLALILNVPMEFFEKKVFRKLKREKLKRFFSLALSIVIFGGMLSLVLGLALPAGIDSVKSLLNSETNVFDKLAESGGIMKFLVTQGKVLFDNFTSKLENYFPRMLDIAKNIFKIIADILLGLGVAIMLLCGKDELKNQIKKLINSFFRYPDKINRIAETTDLAINKFSRYLGGQIIEAFILGVACYIFMVILRLPYAPLISMIIGFVNLIPIVGAYIGGALGAILIFSVSPTKAVVFIVFVIILQQVESFTTYPIVVGKYVGLSGFWIMVSIIIWGGLFGFWGVFLGVPLTAFLHDYIGMLLKKREEAKTLSQTEGTTS